MPNWCEQDLEIRTPEVDNWKDYRKELENFKEHARGRTRYGESVVLYEGNFIPYPLEYALQDARVNAIQKHHLDKYRSDGVKYMSHKEQVEWRNKNPLPREKDGFNRGGYEWCCEAYGSKWGISRPKLVEEDIEWGQLIYSFESAWSPVKPIINKMSELFPNLIFKLTYYEKGMAVHGIYKVKAGKILENKETEYWGNRGG